MAKIDGNVIAMNPYAASTGGISGVIISKRENFDGEVEIIARHRNKTRKTKGPNEIGYFEEQNRLNRFKTVSQALLKIKSGLSGFSFKTGKGYTLQRAIQINNNNDFINQNPSVEINPITQENLPTAFNAVWEQLILARQTSDFNSIASFANVANADNGDGTGTLSFDLNAANAKDCYINTVVIQPDADVPVQQSLFENKLSNGTVTMNYNLPGAGDSFFFAYLVSIDNSETSDSMRIAI